MHDRFRFLRPWFLMLPAGGGAVLAAAGAGGKSEWLRRLLRVYREQERRVLWTQTVDHPAPAELVAAAWPAEAARAHAALQGDGAVFVGANPAGDGRWQGLEPAQVERARSALQPDIVLVEAHAPTGTSLRHDAQPPRWPPAVDVAFLVGHLGATGRVFGPRVVAGSQQPPHVQGEEPRRVALTDYQQMFLGTTGLLAMTPAAGLVVPVLTGFGSYRDIDGMFALVQGLWAHPAVKVVCLAELLGDARRDAADLQWVDAAQMPTSLVAGERIYAVYPAELDEDGPSDRADHPPPGPDAA